MLSIYKWISSWTYLFPDFYSLFSIQGITDERKIYKYTFLLFSRGYSLSLLRKNMTTMLVHVPNGFKRLKLNGKDKWKKYILRNILIKMYFPKK